MYDYKKLTIGIAPTRRDFFPPPANAVAMKKQIMTRLDGIFAKLGVDTVNIDSINDEGLLFDNADVPAAEALFREKKIDALFFPHANFGQEEPVAKLAAKFNVPVLLWGPHDEHPPAKGTARSRQTDIQCGMFATSKAFLHYGVKFTYLENCWLDSDILDKGIESFVRVATVVKAVRGLRILQLSTRPRQFLSVKVNESELLEKFGIEVTPIESGEVMRTVEGIKANRQGDIDKLLKEWAATYQFDAASEDVKENLAAAELAIIELADKYQCPVVSGECWSLFRSHFGIRTCFLFGDLINKGLPVACENDIHGCVSQVALSAVSRGESATFLADLTIRHPNNDNAELLWHCGPFPVSLMKEGAKPEVVGAANGEWEIKGGDVTLCRFDGAMGEYLLFADECRGVEGPWTNGNYLWVETDDWVKWEQKLMYGPYIHHIVGVHGKFKKELAEACVYLGDIEHDDADKPCKR